MAKAKDFPGLSSEDTYGEAAAKIISTRGQELTEHARGVLDTTDIERVHDMRVATRRLRAALEIFEPCFPAGSYGDTLAEVKAIADALGERRDRDVTIEALERFVDGLASPDRPGVAGLIEEIRAEQADANAELEAFVSSHRLAALSERLSELVVEAEALGSTAR